MKISGLRENKNTWNSNVINPLVSIITVVFNGEHFLEVAIKSILNQTYNKIEYIIIDGASTDNSVDIIKSYESHFKEKGYFFKWISENDNGISDAFNKGISLATGELIGITNSDDWLESNAVEIIVENLDKNFSIYCGYLRIYDRDLIFLKLRKSRPFLLPLGMYINHPTVFAKREVYIKNKFDTTFKIAMDYDILLRFRKDGFKIKSINKVIANMRMGGVSWNMRKMRDEEKAVMKRNLPFGLFVVARLKLHVENIIIMIFKLRKKFD